MIYGYLETYDKLEKIWKDTLRIPAIGADDNFFTALGGDSIFAVEVLQKMEEEFQMSFPMFILFRYRTLRSLSEYIVNDQKPLVALELMRKGNEDEGIHIIFIPPIKGGVETYQMATNIYPEGYSLWVLTYDITNNVNSHFVPLKHIVDEAVSNILKICPKRIVLFGYSLGGLIAFEIAAKLPMANRIMLVIGDIPPAKRLKMNLFNLLANDFNKLNKLWANDTNKQKGRVQNLRNIKFGLCYFFIFDNRIRQFEQKNFHLLIEAAHARFYSQFNHPKFSGLAVLIRSLRGALSKRRYNWGKFVSGNLKVYELDTSHKRLMTFTMMSEVAGIVCAEIEKWIAWDKSVKNF
jgi:thioesterase domain-containing protein/acyl carrier protein